MTTAISVVASVDSAEEHLVLTFNDPLFHLHDVQRSTHTDVTSPSLVARLTRMLDVPGPVFLALIDHHEHALEMGFVTRRHRGQWSDITSPHDPRPALWQDIEAELWAALSRLVATARVVEAAS